jgi:hypothetical protein
VDQTDPRRGTAADENAETIRIRARIAVIEDGKHGVLSTLEVREQLDRYPAWTLAEHVEIAARQARINGIRDDQHWYMMLRKRAAAQARGSRRRAMPRQPRPRSRRTGASSSTSSSDPGGDSDPEPPPPRGPAHGVALVWLHGGARLLDAERVGS